MIFKRKQNQHIMLISYYGRVCLATKILSAILQKNGHKTTLVYFKEDRSILLDEPQENAACFQNIRSDIGFGVYGTGHDVNPVTEDDWRILETLALDICPDVIAVSSRSTHLGISRELANRLRLVLPQARFIAGGYGPSIEPIKFLEFMDYVCIGKGDQAILDLVELEDPSECLNVASLRNEQLYLPGLADLPNLDSRPFADWGEQDKYIIEDGKLFPLAERYDASAYGLIASEGCPSTCTYCQACQWPNIYSMYGYSCKKTSTRSPEHVIEELLFAKQSLGVKSITFMDSIFTWNKNWFSRFMALYDEKIDLPFICFTDPRFTSNDQIKRLKQSRLVSTTVGIQSVNPVVREKIMGRKISNSRLVEFAHCLADHGIKPVYDIILWNPFETNETLQSGIELLTQLPFSNIIMIYELKILPKSVLDIMYNEIRPLPIDKNDFIFWSIIFIMLLRFKETREFALNHYMDDFYRKNIVELKNKFFEITNTIVSRERLYALADIPKGTVLRTTMFSDKLSDEITGVHAEYRHAINGKISIRDIIKGELLQEGDFHWQYHPL